MCGCMLSCAVLLFTETGKHSLSSSTCLSKHPAGHPNFPASGESESICTGANLGGAFRGGGQAIVISLFGC